MPISASFHTPRYLRVQIPQRVSALDYAIGEDITPEQIQCGHLVEVPLSRQKRVGVVVDIHDQTPEGFTVKPITRVLWHIPPISEAQRQYMFWLASYYMVNAGLSLRLCLPANPDFFTPIAETLLYRPKSTHEPAKLGKVEQRLWEAIRAQPSLSATDLYKRAEATSAQLKGLLRKDLIEPYPAPKTTYQPNLVPLSEAQEGVYQQISHHFSQLTSRVVLLEGQTGSGKTEVYFKLIAETLAKGRQVLVLLPEVSLLSDWLRRFTERFGKPPAVWHNGITTHQRKRVWQQIARGVLPLLVGARSALHLPFPNLGLVILDEEHDFSYKQEDGVPYHARDMAVVRTKAENIPLLLASATPSLESIANAERGKYHHVRLKSRYGQAQMPDIQVIDLKESRPKSASWLSPILLEALQENLENNQQSLLFLNRRGYAPLLLCTNCGYRVQCQNCSVSLTEHTYPHHRLECHHCGYHCPIPNVCPDCAHPKPWRSSGPGVERIADEVLQHFPTARCFQATAETLSDDQSVQQFIEKMQHRAIDIIIGTQIVAKGLDFPNLTLAGIIDGDQAMFGSNPRAGEQTWQLLQQVAGRTGRHELKGRALIQTQAPNEPLFKALVTQKPDDFWAQQITARKLTKLPPYGRLAGIIVQARNARLAEDWARRIAQANPQGAHHLLGPMPAPIHQLRSWYRYRLLLMSGREIPLQPILQQMIDALSPPSNIKIKIDVDPYSFL